MILKDLILEIPFSLVKKQLIVLYPEQKKNLKGYSLLYSLLLKKRPIKSLTIINTEYVKDKEYGNYWDVFGLESNIRYALDFSSFSQWLGYCVPEIKSKEEKAIFIAHVLWEMTFHGFSDKEIRKGIYQLKQVIKKTKGDKK